MRILFLICLATSGLFGQGYPINTEYNSDLKDFDVLKGQLNAYTVFFDGENHNVASNESRHFNLFKYLYQNNKVRYYIKEYDFDIGFYINKFIHTGDKGWLKFWIPSKEAEHFYDQLYIFNQQLPANEKITFLSVDAYSFKNTEKFVSNLMLDKGEAPQPVRDAVNILKKINRTSSTGMGMDLRGKDKEEIMEQINKVRGMVEIDPSPFKNYFGEDYIFFYLMVFNYASEKRSDENLVRNMTSLSKLAKNGNYYLHYGNAHCSMRLPWFAGALNSKPEFRGHVCSFMSQYYNSEYMIFEYGGTDPGTNEKVFKPNIERGRSFGIIELDEDPKTIERLFSASMGDCTLFRASFLKPSKLGGDLTFIFFLRNQKAMESYYNKK